MKHFSLTLLFLFTFFSFSFSQTYFCSTGGYNNRIGRLDIDNCTFEYYKDYGALFTYNDIALHPDGRMFGVRGNFEGTGGGPLGCWLVEIDMISLEEKDTLALIPESCSSLVCGKDGIFFFGGGFDGGLFSFNPKNGEMTEHGMIGNGLIFAGDLLIYEGNLIGGVVDKYPQEVSQLLRIDLQSPALSEPILDFPDTLVIIGLALQWDSISQKNHLYGGRYDSPAHNSFIYELKPEENEYEEVCIYDFPYSGVLFGLTSTDEFRTNFQLQLDLDADDSSGRLIDHFEIDTLCTWEFPVSDRDVRIISTQGSIDSLAVFPYAGIQHPGEEVIIGTTGEGISIEGINTQRLVLKNEGMATAADFEEALQNVHFLITEATPEAGERVVACVLYANGEASDTAKAFIHVNTATSAQAGEDGYVEVCQEGKDSNVNLFNALGGNPHPGGWWEPSLYEGNTFFSVVDTSGLYR